MSHQNKSSSILWGSFLQCISFNKSGLFRITTITNMAHEIYNSLCEICSRFNLGPIRVPTFSHWKKCTIFQDISANFKRWLKNLFYLSLDVFWVKYHFDQKKGSIVSKLPKFNDFLTVIFPGFPGAVGTLYPII